MENPTTDTELKNYEKFKTYTAITPKITAKLTLYRRRGESSIEENSWYHANLKFETKRVYQMDEQGFQASASYTSLGIQDIFSRMKKAEEGFEELLATNSDNDWKATRNVMRCIHNLETKVDKDFGHLSE